jgi:hypothetical protein
MIFILHAPVTKLGGGASRSALSELFLVFSAIQKSPHDEVKNLVMKVITN